MNIARYYTRRVLFVNERRAIAVFKCDIFNRSEHIRSDSLFRHKGNDYFPTSNNYFQSANCYYPSYRML